jgi:hypothetical protein
VVVLVLVVSGAAGVGAVVVVVSFFVSVFWSHAVVKIGMAMRAARVSAVEKVDFIAISFGCIDAGTTFRCGRTFHPREALPPVSDF